MDGYMSFLKDCYSKILGAYMADEALTTLKTLENQEYFLLRMNQLFVQIYSAERERKIHQLLEDNQKLNYLCSEKGVKQANEEKPEPVRSNSPRFQEQSLNQGQNSSINQLSRHNQALLLKENEQLKAQLKSSREEFITIETKLKTQLQNSLRERKDIQEEAQQKIGRLTENLRETQAKLSLAIQEKEELSKELTKLMESNTKISLKEKREASELQNYLQKNEQLSQQNKAYFQHQQILQGKIKRIEEELKYSQEKITHCEELREQSRSSAEIETFKLRVKIQELMADSSADREQEKLQRSISHAEQKSTELEEEKMKLYQENHTLRTDLTNYKLFSEKRIQQLSEAAKCNSMKYEIEIVSLKESNLKIEGEWSQKHSKEVKRIQEQMDLALEAKQTEQGILKKQLESKISSLKCQLVTAQQTISQREKTQSQPLNQIKQAYEDSQKLQRQFEKSLRFKEEELSSTTKEWDQKSNLLTKELSQKEDLLSKREDQLYQLKQKLSQTNQQMYTYKKQYERITAEDKEQTEDFGVLATQITDLKQQLFHKNAQLSTLEKKITEISEEKHEYSLKTKELQKKVSQLQKQRHESQNMVLQHKSHIIKLQENNQSQVLKLCESHQQNVLKARQEVEKYFQAVISSQEEKIKAMNQSLAATENDSLLLASRNEIQAIRKNLSSLDKKYQQRELEIKEIQEEVNRKEQQYNMLSSMNDKLAEENSKEKAKYTEAIRYYESKLALYAKKFSEFKAQFCIAIKSVLEELKKDLSGIHKNAEQLQTEQAKLLQQFHFNFQVKNESVEEKVLMAAQSLRSHYEHGVVFQLKNQKEDLINDQQKQIREKAIQMMTMLAEQEYSINQLQEREKTLGKRNRELEEKLKIMLKSEEETNSKFMDLKEVLAKMEKKTNQAEYAKITLEKEMSRFQKENLELKNELDQLEVTSKERLENCRQKYLKENQRLFNRYEKELNRIVTMGRKGREMHSFVQNTQQMMEPTKGVCEADSKLSKIRREIEAQKKKISQLAERDT